MIYLGNKTIHHHNGFNSPNIGGSFYRFRIDKLIEGAKVVERTELTNFYGQNVGKVELLDNNIVRVIKKSIANTIEVKYWQLTKSPENLESLGFELLKEW